MKFRIVSDSSSDVLEMKDCSFASVPLKIITNSKEYVDDSALDVDEMVCELEKYNGRSSSSCPNPQDWLKAFDDADNIFCVTITSGLSGSCNAANMAAREYMDANPDKKVYVVDTLSTGPENALIIQKLCEYIDGGFEFEDIVSKIKKYQKRTHLVFALESLHNLANNGRVGSVTAKLAGIIGIRIVGIASEEGTLEITNKSRGAKKMLADILENMKKFGYEGKKVRIHHCHNIEGANAIKSLILALYPKADIEIHKTRALCSFYAERGGLLVGYET